MNMEHKRGVFEEKLEAYLAGDKKRKGEVLKSIVEVTGLTRKGAIKRFRKMQLCDSRMGGRRGRPRTYTPDVVAALKDVWEIGSEACGENLHPQINEYIDIQIREKKWNHNDVATFKLRKMSRASVKVYVGGFTRTRRNFGGKSTTHKSSVISMVPIRMDGWDTPETGVTKISLEAMRASSPFLWTEAHPDSGTEFINAHCVEYAAETNLRMTRSRPYHKNDNCFVEERNGHVVRAYVGYERFDVRATVDALNDLYDVLTPYLNHFIASRRIVSKERIGARWKVTREKVAKTPYQRVLERKDVSEEVKNKLRAEHATLSPATMKKEIDRLIKRVHDIQRRYGNPRKLSKSA